ncbi:Uncharacterised protein [Mycobacteroides abscessus subsp. abscessus]|nr:Uncharacterised protein [Mycobacteroides abscessus subsp. abscessus]
MTQQCCLAGSGVAQHHQERVVGEVERHRCQILFPLADDNLFAPRVQRTDGAGCQVCRQQPDGRCLGAGVVGVDRIHRLGVGGGEQEVLGLHGQAAARLIVRNALGRPTQRARYPHIAVRRVVQLEFETQPQRVAHRQRHFDPVRCRDHDMDAVRQSGVSQLGEPGEQRVSSIELIGVVTAERVQVVHDQEGLAVAVVQRAVAVTQGT